MLQKNKLDFSEFFSISPEEWKKHILKELKAQSEEILFHRSESLVTKGFYTSEDIVEINGLTKFQQRYLIKSPRHWYTSEYILFDNADSVNKHAKHAINNGADSLYIELNNHVLSENEASILFNNISLNYSLVYLKTNTSLEDLANAFSGEKCSGLKGSLERSDINKHVDNPQLLFNEFEKAYQVLKETPNLKAFSINADELNLKKQGQLQEIAYSIGFAIELIDYLTNKNIPLKEILNNISFSFSIGKNYFMEIAKLRAFRWVWDTICTEYDKSYDSFATHVHCNTSSIDFTDDPNYNILYNTTEAMAAIIGGCDSLTIMPSDIHKKSYNEFSSRIARNISLILKEEAHLEYVSDPAGGSYLVESLTAQIAQKALEEIKLIESKGGIFNYLKGV